MNFSNLLRRAKKGDTDAIMDIVNLYDPLVTKEAIVEGVFDEDLYQELRMVLLTCIRAFSV